MTTTNNITTTTMNINIYNNTDQTITLNTDLLNNNPPNVFIPTKVCSTCRIIKFITEFSKSKISHKGYQNQCKNCVKNKRQKYYNENKDKIAMTHKEYYTNTRINKTNIVNKKR